MLRPVASAPPSSQDRARIDAGAAEREAVAKAQAGDRAALGALLSRYGPTLYRTVLLPRLGSEAAARDALSDTYAKVVERIDKFVWQNVGFYPWLRTVALRVALDQLRARKRLVIWSAEDVEREVDEASSATPTDEKLSAHRDERAAKAKVEAALANIHPRYAEAIRLRILDERSREDVATVLGVTPATFDVLLHRATAALRKAIAPSPQMAPSGKAEGVEPDPQGQAKNMASRPHARARATKRAGDPNDDNA